MLGPSVYSSALDFIFCLHRDSRLDRGKKLGTSEVFPGHVCGLVHEYNLLVPQECARAFQTLWTSHSSDLAFMFLARLLFICDVK